MIYVLLLRRVPSKCAGVSASSIAVQSPYMAQVQLLCDRIEDIQGAEGVQVASVDSFQGREADAVVISMVVLLHSTGIK